MVFAKVMKDESVKGSLFDLIEKIRKETRDCPLRIQGYVYSTYMYK